MSIIVIPNRICKKCGGNIWRSIPNTSWYRCADCERAIQRKLSQRHSKNLTDVYLRKVFRRYNKIEWEDASDEYKELYRKSIKTHRMIKEIEEKNSLINVSYSQIGKMTDKQLEEYLIKLYSMDLNGCKRSEKQKVYALRSYTNKVLRNRKEIPWHFNEKLNKLKEEHGLLYRPRRKEVPNTEEHLNEAIALEGIPEVQTTQVPVPSQAATDIIEELKRVEARRKEILDTIMEFNDYVESLKIRV